MGYFFSATHAVTGDAVVTFFTFAMQRMAVWTSMHLIFRNYKRGRLMSPPPVTLQVSAIRFRKWQETPLSAAHARHARPVHGGRSHRARYASGAPSPARSLCGGNPGSMMRR